MSPHRLSLKQLHYFLVLAEEQNFRQAAERLCMTQPPLSRQIRSLEESLGSPLFMRTRQCVRLTPAGQRLLPQARALLQHAQKVLAGFQPDAPLPQLPAPIIRIGITPVIEADHFLAAQRTFAQKQPDVTLTIRPQSSATSIRDIRQRRLDLAIIGLPARVQGLVTIPLHDDPLMVCLPAQHPLARQRRLSLAMLAQERLLWFERRLHPTYYDHCQNVFDRCDFSPARLPEPTDHHVLLSMVAAGQGVSLIPQSLRRITHPGVVFRPLAEGRLLQISVSIVHAPDLNATGVHTLIGLLRSRLARPKQPAGRRRR